MMIYKRCKAVILKNRKPGLTHTRMMGRAKNEEKEDLMN